MTLISAPKISKDSWLNNPEYNSFVAGYEYAATQTRAIKGLGKISPEDAYFIYEAIKRGVNIAPATLPLYTIQRIKPNDQVFGFAHYSNNAEKTLCGKAVNTNWTVITNNGKGVSDCPACKKCLKIDRISK